jgi:hypothetical protein
MAFGQSAAGSQHERNLMDEEKINYDNVFVLTFLLMNVNLFTQAGFSAVWEFSAVCLSSIG